MSTLENFINDFLQSTTDDDPTQAAMSRPPRRGLFGRKVELPPPPPPTLVESLKEVLKKVDVVTHLQWAAVAGLMLLTFYHVYMQYTAAKGKKGSSASSETKAKARSWLSSITKSGEDRATEAVAPPAEARTVATPESKPPPMSRAKSVRKAAAKLTGMSGAFSGKKKADAVPKADKAAAADAKGRAPTTEAAAAPAPASTKEAVVEKVEVATDKAEAAAATKVDEAAAAAKTEAADKVDAVSEKLGVDAPVSMEVIDQAAELTKGKVAEGGAATDDAVKKAVVGPAQ